METLQILGWIYLGIILGCMGGVLGLSLFQVRNVADLKAEIRDLRLQRQLLKEEIFRLSKNYKPRKPQPRLRRNFKKNNRKK